MPCTMEHRSNEFLQIKQRKINWHPRGCQFGFWTTLTLGAYNKIQAKYKRYMELNPKMKENVDKLLLQN